jgi:CDP-2,3-bis-(O-geranylgeranyl)-sn-glycerol synthase
VDHGVLILSRILQCLYLMLPAYFANMTPPFVRFWKGWNRPINQRLLGTHKTIVGFLAGIVVAVATTYVQSRINWNGSLVAYSHWFFLGLAFGFGAMGGDSIKSLLKRRRAIAPGSSWIPMDQLDFVVGALLAISPWVRLAWLDVIAILIISFLADIVINHLAFWLGIRQSKW